MMHTTVGRVSWSLSSFFVGLAVGGSERNQRIRSLSQGFPFPSGHVDLRDLSRDPPLKALSCDQGRKDPAPECTRKPMLPRHQEAEYKIGRLQHPFSDGFTFAFVRVEPARFFRAH